MTRMNFLAVNMYFEQTIEAKSSEQHGLDIHFLILHVKSVSLVKAVVRHSVREEKS